MGKRSQTFLRKKMSHHPCCKQNWYSHRSRTYQRTGERPHCKEFYTILPTILFCCNSANSFMWNCTDLDSKRHSRIIPMYETIFFNCTNVQTLFLGTNQDREDGKTCGKNWRNRIYWNLSKDQRKSSTFVWNCNQGGL